VCGEIKLSHD
jgi:hypothetical protein